MNGDFDLEITQAAMEQASKEIRQLRTENARLRADLITAGEAHEWVCVRLDKAMVALREIGSVPDWKDLPYVTDHGALRSLVGIARQALREIEGEKEVGDA